MYVLLHIPIQSVMTYLKILLAESISLLMITALQVFTTILRKAFQSFHSMLSFLLRWVGAFWQSKGLTVIPTISWSDTRSYGFCFDGIEKSSIVAVGMVGCKTDNKSAFLRGYNAMLEHIDPIAIICFAAPFPEMQGNIIAVDYLDSRKVVR